MPPKGSPKGKSNRQITSFFKPKPTTSTSPTQPPPQSETPKPESSPRVSPKPHSTQEPPSSPAFPDLGVDSPATDVKAPPPRPDVIAASDEDDSDDTNDSSEGGFKDLMATFDRGKPAAAAATRSFETPKAKRTMDLFHSSPLTINTKPKFMFDMKSLARDAKADDATNASSAQLKELAAEVEEDEAVRNVDVDTTIKDIVQDQGGANAHKVMRAVHRAGDHTAPHFRFFKTQFKQPEPVPIPKKLKKGPWKHLVHQDPNVREQYMASRWLYTASQRRGELPQELFEWILDDLPRQSSKLFLSEYVGIVSCCPGQVESLITIDRLRRMFVDLGAADETNPRETRDTVSRQSENFYQGYDWTSLQYFFKFLDKIAESMSLDAVDYAARTLLRLSMDRFLICTVDVLMEYEAAMQSLLRCLHSGPGWNSFCLDCCVALHDDFKNQNIRLNALLALPISGQHTHDLRRRLAVTFLFEESSFGAQYPSEYMTIRRIVERLDQDDFTVNSKTDFEEFRARIIILDMVIDSGSFIPSGNPEDESSFNADVDELTSRLRTFWTKINDAGLKLSRAQTKSVVEWVQKRVAVSVRTRRQAKTDIYDAPLRDDPFIPRQQAMMKEFLGKKVRD